MQSLNDRIHNYVPFFGKWDLDTPPKLLGEGNSGTVYLVHSDAAEAALKVIPIPKDDRQYSDMLASMGGSVARVNAWIDQELRYARTEIEIMERLKSDSHIVCFEDAAVIPRTDTYGFDVIIRMERLVQGIQDYEKIQLLMGELTGRKLELLRQTVEKFRSNKYEPKDDAAQMIRQAEAVLRQLE